MGKYKYQKETLIFILLLFFLSNLILIFYQDNVWWDAAVYAGMGKHMFSAGESGLWESSRPVVWPLILGLLWKLNLDVVFFGKLTSLLFAVGVLVMTFLIGKELFDEKTALLTVFLLALTPTFFSFSKIMLSGIVSTFFVLTAVYFLIKKNYVVAGIFFGIGFMTRFLQLLVLVVVIALLMLYKKPIRKSLNLLAGFSIPVVPYLVLNYFLYNNIFHPFSLQVLLTQVTGWMWSEPIFFYFIEVFKENFLYVFAVFGLIYLFKKKLSLEKGMIVYMFLALFLFFLFTQHKEMRFLVVLFPYLAMITAYGSIRFFDNIKINFPLRYILVIFVVQALLNIYVYEKIEIGKGNQFTVFQSYAEDGVWVSNPVHAVYSDAKIGELMYYPAFNKDKIDFLNSNLEKINIILLDTCNLLCNPEDYSCFGEKEIFLSNLKEKFKMSYNNKYGNCQQYIFSK
jgi:hypothetical protein